MVEWYMLGLFNPDLNRNLPIGTPYPAQEKGQPNLTKPLFDFLILYDLRTIFAAVHVYCLR